MPEASKSRFETIVHDLASLARLFDHTALKPDARQAAVEQLCREARQHGFKAVCLNPRFVPLAKRLLEGSPTLLCTVVGFPLGATTSDAKASETAQAVADGADEIDMVIPIGAALDGRWDEVERDVRSVVAASKQAVVKVIFETAFLSADEIKTLCQISWGAGAQYVKTSTGFASRGASTEDIALMDAARKTLPCTRAQEPKIKASGGIRTLADVRAMVDAGADRIGASASVSILEEYQRLLTFL